MRHGEDIGLDINFTDLNIFQQFKCVGLTDERGTALSE